MEGPSIYVRYSRISVTLGSILQWDVTNLYNGCEVRFVDTVNETSVYHQAENVCELLLLPQLTLSETYSGSFDISN